MGQRGKCSTTAFVAGNSVGAAMLGPAIGGGLDSNGQLP